MVKLSPSLISANFANLEKDVKECEENGIDMFHLDIMDGHFVPNITMGPIIVKNIRKITKAKLDSHLMITDPEKYMRDFVDAGTDIITYHIESLKSLDLLKLTKNLGLKTGLALNPETNLSRVISYLKNVDILLIMSVHPGFSGQKFIDESIHKIKEARNYIDSKNLDVEIEVDGGINTENIRSVVDAGADILAVATSLFNGNIKENLRKLIEYLK